MKFNTVILYDIENLIKGYGFKDNFRDKVSLKKVYEQIAKYDAVEKIGIQRAYANWGNIRMSFMSQDITHLGIEPIQVFGFAKGASKNAADIHLVIDAIELCYTRPNIEVFVIVSGDGGFASLGKKLHEHGKIVVGCAYEGTTSDVFKSVCDHFIWLTDPDVEIREELKAKKKLKAKGVKKKALPKTIEKETPKPKVEQPKAEQPKPKPKPPEPKKQVKEQKKSPLSPMEQLTTQIEPITDASTEDKLSQINAILHWLNDNKEISNELGSKGLMPSKVKLMFRAVMNGDVNTSHFGYLKFTNFLRFVCSGTPLAVYKNIKNNTIRVGYRNQPLEGYEIQANANRVNIHTPTGYRKILKNGKPIYKLPTDKFIILDIIEELVNGKHISKSLEALINDVSASLKNVDKEDIKQVLFILLAAGCFDRTPANVPLAQQLLKLKPQYESEKTIINHLKRLFFEKIAEITQQDVQGEILMQII